MRPSTSRPCNVEQRPVLQLHEVEKNRTENFRSASRDQEKGAVIPFQKSLSLHQQSLRISCICNKNNSKRRIAQKTMGGTFSRGNQNVGKNGRLSDAYFMAFFAKLRANRVQSVTTSQASTNGVFAPLSIWRGRHDNGALLWAISWPHYIVTFCQSVHDSSIFHA